MSTWQKSIALHEAAHAVAGRVLGMTTFELVACRLGETLGNRARGFAAVGIAPNGIADAVMRFSGGIAGTIGIGGTWHHVEWDEILWSVCSYRAAMKANPPALPVECEPVTVEPWTVPAVEDHAALTAFGVQGLTADFSEIGRIIDCALPEGRDDYGILFRLMWSDLQNQAIKLVVDHLETIRRLADHLLDNGGRLTGEQLAVFFEREGL